MTPLPSIALITFAAAAAASFGAQAETLAPASQEPRPAARSDLARAAFRIRAPAQSAPRPTGVAQTSVERRFGGDDTVAFGFLCGRYAGVALGGIADARGYDPQGKFLGGKISLAFR